MERDIGLDERRVLWLRRCGTGSSGRKGSPMKSRGTTNRFLRSWTIRRAITRMRPTRSLPTRPALSPRSRTRLSGLRVSWFPGASSRETVWRFSFPIFLITRRSFSASSKRAAFVLPAIPCTRSLSSIFSSKTAGQRPCSSWITLPSTRRRSRPWKGPPWRRW